MRILTEEYGEVFGVVDKHLQRFSINALDNVWCGRSKLEDPFQDLFLVHHITRVDLPELVSIEGQRRQSWQIVFLFDTLVGDLHEVDILFFALVVDVLEFLKDLLALLVTFFVCKQTTCDASLLLVGGSNNNLLD